MLVERIHVEDEETSYLREEGYILEYSLHVADTVQVIDTVEGAEGYVDSAEHIEPAHILTEILYIKSAVELFIKRDAEHFVGIVNAYHVVAETRHFLRDTACAAGKVEEDTAVDIAEFSDDIVEISGTLPVVDISCELVVIPCKNAVSSH